MLEEDPRKQPGETLTEFYRRVGNRELWGSESSALDEFEKVLGRPDWEPSNPYAGGYDAPIEVGVLAALLKGDGEALKLLSKQANLIAFGVHPDLDDMGELHTAALLRQSGLDARIFPAAKGRRTPDIVVDVPKKLDIEVATARQKHGTRALSARIANLRAALPKRPGVDLVVYLFGVATPDIETAVVRAAHRVRVSEYIEDPGVWRLAALPTGDRRSTALEAAARNGLEPRDWIGPKVLTLQVTLGDVPSNRAEVVSLVPREDYRNPVVRKADRPQRRGNHPYLIAVNVGAMLGAPGLLSDLRVALTAWDHVSAVLMYYPLFTMSSKLWRVQLIRNPAAAQPLPPGTLHGIGETPIEVTVTRI